MLGSYTPQVPRHPCRRTNRPPRPRPSPVSVHYMQSRNRSAENPPDLRCSIRKPAPGRYSKIFAVDGEDASILSTKSDTAAAIRYALSHWRALTRYVDEGLLEIDNSAAERALRAVAIGRKNYLFMGSDSGGQRAAAFYSPHRNGQAQRDRSSLLPANRPGTHR